ncbi:MAG: hypothetical protein JW742_04655 [Candidatus Aminicenantes bacterium]|nr:hypothetical protein [Candidatus Aminicenantes bacterium]
MKQLALAVALLVGGLPLVLPGQAVSEEEAAPAFRTSGYFSLDFLKGQRASGFHQGSLQDVRGGLAFSGTAGGAWDYVFESRFRSEGEFTIEQAFLRLNLSGVRVRAGMFLVPFGVYNTSNRPHEQALARVPLVVEQAYPASWRELGACVEGTFSFLSYSVYGGNGLGEGARLKDGQQFKDGNADKGFGGRAGVKLDTVELGYSYHQSRVGEGNRRRLVLQAADATWKTMEFQILGEYIWTRMDNPAPFGRGVCRGYHVQALFPFGTTSLVVGRQEVKYKDPFHGEGFVAPDTAGAGIDDRRTRWALEILYAPLPDLLVKVEYDFNREGGPERNDDLLTAQIALKF